MTNKPYLPPVPLDDDTLTITAIESVIPYDLFPGLLLVRIHTDAGIIGHGETYYAPEAVAGMLHDWMAQRLLGADALAIESHWRFLYERASNFGVRGTELRAISAIDLALWDILGQITNKPIYRLLGGPVRERIPVYNSCGNPGYGPNPDRDKPTEHFWPGQGPIGSPGPLADSYNLFHNPVELAQELYEKGYRGLKVWPFDKAAIQHGGMRISLRDVEEAVAPLRKIRETLGDDMELLVDGHAAFYPVAALRIADALREVKPLWLEDMIRMDSIEALADFRRQSRMPISASEMLLSRPDFAELLTKQAADFVMIDPTWIGGISETIRVAHMANAWNVPVTMHDCTGPLTLFAGLQANAAVPNCCYQETVRAQIRTVYPHLIDEEVKIKDGHIDIPRRPGLGVKLDPALFTEKREGYRVSKI